MTPLEQYREQEQLDYEEYLEWSKTFEVPEDGQATDFVLLMFWPLPIFAILLIAHFLGAPK